MIDAMTSLGGLADQLGSRVQKLAALMAEAEPDELAFVAFPTNPPGGLHVTNHSVLRRAQDEGWTCEFRRRRT